MKMKFTMIKIMLCFCWKNRPGLFVKFTTGVREDIKADLDVMQPRDLNDALKLAIAIERKLTLADAKVNAARTVWWKKPFC